MKKLILLDGYALIYRAYYALIRTPRINSKGMNTSAVMGFVNTLEEVLKKENPEFIGVAFDPKGGTFRHEIYPEYKAQREDTPEDIRVAVPIIKQILGAYRIPVLEIPGYEADDVIGTLANKASQHCDVLTYMVTPDKDYSQLVNDTVKMMKPRHGGGFEIVGPAEICERYGIDNPSQVIDLLGLMGDASDNVPGCPGVGEKTAVKLIKEFGSIEQLISRCDELKGALKTKVESNVEGIRFSRLLVTIKTDVPVELDFDLLSRKDIDVDLMRKLFDELEFKTLLNRVIGSHTSQSDNTKSVGSTPVIQPRNDGQLDLFSVNSTSVSSDENVKDSQKDAAQSNSLPNNEMFGDLFSAMPSMQSLDTIPHTYSLIDTDEKLSHFIDEIKDSDVICLDTETTSTEAMNAELVGLSFSVKEGVAYYIPVPSERPSALNLMTRLKPLYENPASLKVGHNMKYDIMVLARYGITLKGDMFDTMVAHYILHPEMRHGMDYLAEICLNYRTIHIEQLIGEKGKNQRTMRDIEPALVCDYAAEDADVTLKLKNLLEKELVKENLYQLFSTVEMPLVPVLARMEMNGARIDIDSLAETSRIFSDEMASIEKKIYELAGLEFNISSPRQVGEILFEKLKIVEKAKRTKTGQYVTSEDVLQSLKGKHEIVELILDYRGYKKLLSTYIDALPELINPETGHIHTSFNQTVTATGRLSSSNPNLQNIPIRDANGKEVRKAFIPDDGCEFFSADYSQIELRIMAHLSDDKHMIEAFNSGYDIHAATASKIFKKPIEEITSDERRKAKTANFGIIYGITTFGLAERMQVSRSEAKQLIDEYFQTYHKVKEYMDKSIEIAREKGYTETLFGRRCYLPDINSRNSVVRGYAERNAINAPIQGSAADIVKVAMSRIDKRMQERKMRSKMILQVHDELNFSVYPEEKEVLQQIVIEEMQNAVQLKVPLIADCGWGKNWLEAH